MEIKTMLYFSLFLVFFRISASSFEESETAEISSDLDEFGLPLFNIHGRVRRDTGVADTDADDKDADDTVTDYADSDSQEEEELFEFQDHHTYYTSKLFYIDDIDKYWIPLQNDSKHHILSNTYLYGVQENVTFDFRFYGHKIQRVVLTNAGFISTSPLFHNKMYDTQYIAPYMAPYDPTLGERSNVLYEIIGREKFVVEWQDVFVLFKDALIGPFHFQAIIHKDGRIMFLYKKLPASFSEITVGLAESVWFDTNQPSGGPCNVKIDDSSTQISAMVSTQIQPMKNPYDCDAGPDDNQSEDQNEIEVDDDDVNDEEDNSPKSKRPASTASTCNPCSKRTKSHEGTTRAQSSTSSVQKKVLERQEEEHQARMTLYRTQLEHAIEEHKIKMEILQLEKQRVLASIGDNSSVSLTINTSATQTTPRTSPSIFSISEIIKPSVG